MTVIDEGHRADVVIGYAFIIQEQKEKEEGGATLKKDQQ